VAYARTVVLFVATAVAEILGCYLTFLCVRKDRSFWLLAPAAFSLSLFAWLLTLHPTGASRTYAAYGGVYVTTALFWLWMVEHQQPDKWDLIGGAVAIAGMAIIAFSPR
jgi:small multidrug resistance family-3 protein